MYRYSLLPELCAGISREMSHKTKHFHFLKLPIFMVGVMFCCSVVYIARAQGSSVKSIPCALKSGSGEWDTDILSIDKQHYLCDDNTSCEGYYVGAASGSIHKSGGFTTLGWGRWVKCYIGVVVDEWQNESDIKRCTKEEISAHNQGASLVLLNSYSNTNYGKPVIIKGNSILKSSVAVKSNQKGGYCVAYQCKNNTIANDDHSKCITPVVEEVVVAESPQTETPAILTDASTRELAVTLLDADPCDTETGCVPTCVAGAETVDFRGGKCQAITCTNNFYLVKNAAGVSMGWCYGKICPTGQHVQTDERNMVLPSDVKCVADEVTPTTAPTTGGGGGNGTGGPYTIGGQIINQDGEVLPGATVFYGTSSGTAANMNGGFTLSGIPHGTEVGFRYIGCNDQTKTITANADNLTIKMDCSGIDTGEVVIIGSKEPSTEESVEVPVVTTETVAEFTDSADGADCKEQMYMADTATYQNGVCTVHKCCAGFEVKENQCVEISGPCESLPDNATRGNRQYDAGTDSVKCIITDCVDGYVVSDDQLSCREDYEALADAAREREQSFGNKLLGAVGMGATGIGGAMLMSGLAESASDDEAERAMKAYLSTFTCKYGNESVPGGAMNVEIPGGNELIQMYAEYVALANDLKVRKEALGMKPGIESEAILDSATSGLYDDVSTGKTQGAYASLARALSDPNSEDAKIWAAQREESDEKKKTGAITAGTGVGASLVGNIISEGVDKNKNK